MTFSTSGRETILAKKTPEQIAASIKKMPNPVAAAKRTELLDIGLKSNHVVGAFFTLKRLFDDMQVALEKTQWMIGDTFAMADVAVLAYVDRLERLGLAGLFAERTPVVANWLAAAQERPSYSAALDPFVSAETAANLRTVGARFWPEVEEKWRVFLENSP